MATHLEYLENLEKSGNSKVVREKSGKLKFAEELKSLSCSFWQFVGLDFGYVHH